MALNIATALVRGGSLKPPPRVDKFEESTSRDMRPLKRSRTHFQRSQFIGQPYRKNGRPEEDYSELARKYGRSFQCGFMLKKLDGFH
jgi:hypothetical protein